MDEPDIRVTSIGESLALARLSEGAECTQSAERRFLEHYGLNEQPFGVTPDPRFLYLGPKHRQALAALTYGTELNRGFLTLIAKPGMGKTSLLFQYLESLRNKARTAFLFQTDCDSHDLMRHLLTDLHLDGGGKDLPEMRLTLNRFLTGEMDAGRPFILVIDEAQNLDDRVLESVRLLSNFETPWMKLMQIVLAGQPQLADRLAKPSMAQLKQRISFAIRVEPLTGEEVSTYIDHRLWVAGYKGSSLLSPGARALITENSEGIPRNINNMCFCAMSFAWAMKQKTIDREMMRDVLADIDLGSSKRKTDFTLKSENQLEHSFSQNLRPTVVTAKEPPARSWLAKAAIASAVLFALGWSAVHLDIGKRFMSIAAAAKSSVVLTPAPVSLDPIAPATPDNSSPGPKSEAPTDDKNPGVPQQGGVQSTLSSREPN
jgi:general secretion pathway protein A